jgi:hypothetical protein
LPSSFLLLTSHFYFYFYFCGEFLATIKMAPWLIQIFGKQISQIRHISKEKISNC